MDALNEMGILRLEGVFAPSDADAMRSRIWQALADVHGVHADDPDSWTIERATHLQAVKRDPVFDPIGGPALLTALDRILGEWERPDTWGGMLVTFPRRGLTEWTVPTGEWHADFGFDVAPTPLAGVTVLTYLSAVGPGAGGTVALAGSHRVVERFLPRCPGQNLSANPSVRRRLFRSDPWLRELTLGDSTPDRVERFMGQTARIHGEDVTVVELTGQPGDVVLMHPWLLHTFAPHTATAPRMMRVCTIHRRVPAPA